MSPSHRTDSQSQSHVWLGLARPQGSGFMRLPIDMLRLVQGYTSINKLLSCCREGRELWPELFYWRFRGDRARKVYMYPGRPMGLRTAGVCAS